MSPFIKFLVTVLYKYDNTLRKYAVSIHMDMLKADCIEHPMKSASRKEIYSCLPDYLRGLGDIVEIETIYALEIIENNKLRI